MLTLIYRGDNRSLYMPHIRKDIRLELVTGAAALCFASFFKYIVLFFFYLTRQRRALRTDLNQIFQNDVIGMKQIMTDLRYHASELERRGSK